MHMLLSHFCMTIQNRCPNTSEILELICNNFSYFKGEEYKLFWPESSEFVRMSSTFGAKIIPFGAVGEDDIAQVIN